MINLEEYEFDNFIEENETVLIDFWAEWCGPCRLLSPILEELDKENENWVIAKVNVDEAELVARKYNISSIPTLALFKNGKMVSRMEGARPKHLIVKQFGELIQ